MNGVDIDAVHKRQANDVTVARLEVELGKAADRDAAHALAAFRQVQADARAELEPLTQRQRDILVMTAKGLDKKGVAEALGVSHHTVNDHQQQIRNRLGLTTVEAVVLAAKAGWA